MEPVKIYIEITAGDNVKYELDHETNQLMVDRFLHTAFSYPFNYGFVENTLSEDNDPADIILLSSNKVVPGVLIKGKVIGMLEMEDEAGVDTKLIAVPIEKVDPIYGALQSIEEVPTHTKEMIKHFFDHYKDLEKGKWVKTRNWLGREQAEAELQACIDRYQKHQ